MQLLSLTEALAQSPPYSDLGGNILLVQLHLKPVAVSKHPVVIAVMKVLVDIVSYLPDSPGIQVRPRIN